MGLCGGLGEQRMWLFPHFRCLPLSHCLPLGDGQRSGNAPGVHAYAGDSVVGARCWLGWTELEGGPGPQGRTGGYQAGCAGTGFIQGWTLLGKENGAKKSHMK